MSETLERPVFQATNREGRNAADAPFLRPLERPTFHATDEDPSLGFPTHPIRSLEHPAFQRAWHDGGSA